MELTVYLSGEIHTNWREEIIQKCEVLGLPIEFLSPVTNHELSDDVGVEILGKEDKKFWHDHKSAKINSIRTKNAIERADVVVVDLEINISNGTQLLMRDMLLAYLKV